MYDLPSHIAFPGELTGGPPSGVIIGGGGLQSAGWVSEPQIPLWRQTAETDHIGCHTAGEFDDGGVTRDIIYAAYEYFITEFVKDWSVRTENPHEANLFFIPALVGEGGWKEG